MIKRYYKLYCDYCGDLLGEYDHKPSREELENLCLFCTATKVFCSNPCFSNWNHDRQERQYMNLAQNGKIHNDE